MKNLLQESKKKYYQSQYGIAYNPGGASTSVAQTPQLQIPQTESTEAGDLYSDLDEYNRV